MKTISKVVKWCAYLAAMLQLVELGLAIYNKSSYSGLSLYSLMVIQALSWVVIGYIETEDR